MTPIPVMINGLPGNVAQVIARHVLQDPRFQLLPMAFTGPDIEAPSVTIGSFECELIRPEHRDPAMVRIRRLAPENRLRVVDLTHPSSVNSNAEYYCAQGIPFVMGTTGGDRQRLEQTVRQSTVSAVIAPNMARQIVGLQAMLAYAAERFPGLYQGYSLRVRESHQAGKADTSGTARAMVGYFRRLGVNFQEDEIEMERDPERQRRAWGVPEAYLGGHGWHTYTLTSPDRTATFEFTHNVNGREIYGEGTLEAILFLEAKVRAGSRGEVFSMLDVLSGSARHPV